MNHKRMKSVNVASIILAGGEGTRLKPLTEIRCKPAVTFGGRYRIIDVAISNSLNAGFKDIYVLSQFLAASLTSYLLETYSSNGFLGTYIQVLTPEQNSDNKKMWYEGTADAVRKNLSKLLEHPADYYVILSGDQLYSMDLGEMVEMAKDKDADLVIATIPVNESDAKRMGVMKIDENQEIKSFFEKPQEAKTLIEFAISPEVSAKNGFLNNLTFLGSMGIYVFKREALVNLLKEDNRSDFGKHLIPSQLKKGKTFAYVFDGYWEDIGTISSYYNANICLTKNSHACLDLYNEIRPIYSQSLSLPSARILNTNVMDSIICEGSVVSAAHISQSMIGLKTQIDDNSIILNSIIMGSPPKTLKQNTYIGKNCKLDKVIVDEGAYVEDGVELTNINQIKNLESDLFHISDGIIVVKSGARIPTGFRI
jgi:glucose-1-phosphate adenylyltransferase